MRWPWSRRGAPTRFAIMDAAGDRTLVMYVGDNRAEVRYALDCAPDAVGPKTKTLLDMLDAGEVPDVRDAQREFAVQVVACQD